MAKHAVCCDGWFYNAKHEAGCDQEHMLRNPSCNWCGEVLDPKDGHCMACPVTPEELDDGWTIGLPLLRVCFRCGETIDGTLRWQEVFTFGPRTNAFSRAVSFCMPCAKHLELCP